MLHSYCLLIWTHLLTIYNLTYSYHLAKGYKFCDFLYFSSFQYGIFSWNKKLSVSRADSYFCELNPIVKGSQNENYMTMPVFPYALKIVGSVVQDGTAPLGAFLTESSLFAQSHLPNEFYDLLFANCFCLYSCLTYSRSVWIYVTQVWCIYNVFCFSSILLQLYKVPYLFSYKMEVYLSKIAANM